MGDTHIRNPVEWAAGGVGTVRSATGGMVNPLLGAEAGRTERPQIRHLELSDLEVALRRGWEDFTAARSDVFLLAILYPLIGLGLAWASFHYDLVPLLFAMASGFALVGPIAAVGLYEVSRRREAGEDAGLGAMAGVARAPGFPAILLFGLLLGAIFFAWVFVAYLLYGPLTEGATSTSPGAFLAGLLTSASGLAVLFVGFLFALLVLAIGVVSPPMMLDRDVGVARAVATSLRVAAANPGPIAAWGLVVAAMLFLGSLPLFLGLAVALPVLGHATWHLYRLAVEPPAGPAAADGSA